MAENAWKGVVCLEFVKEKKAICASSATLTEPSARVRFRPLFPNKKAPVREPFYLERVKGIEPSYSAWEAAALPLSYTRKSFIVQSRH